jgi:hypothetical protein
MLSILEIGGTVSAMELSLPVQIAAQAAFTAQNFQHTHCSAYVAAAAFYLDIYILRPPNHQQLHLANAQVSWLGADGVENGPTAEEAGWSPSGNERGAPSFCSGGMQPALMHLID